MTNRQGRQERKGKRFVQVFCPSPVSFGKIGMLPYDAECGLWDKHWQKNVEWVQYYLQQCPPSIRFG
ncbi:hypothetical protein [Nostoc sp. NMS1]|uniref:hypothetical protein n=1 Tax=Nostoc sp. NMS1 TaxID=2815388 RepID=UPI0025D5E140|nr:hypothetical protein [Nostoc sp. NMS1]